MHPRIHHMSPEEFRRHGRAVVDWIADYMTRVESLPVHPEVAPGAVRRALPAAPPDRGEDFTVMLDDVERVVMPAITHWQSPNFFAYFPANASGPSILGELLSAGLGVQGMLWTTSPACTELETHVLDWLVDMLGLPAKFRSSAKGGGVIQDTASSAALCALLAARERASGFTTNAVGVDRRFTAYCSAHAHSSIEKAATIAGIGRDNVRHVEVDDAYRMRPEALRAAIDRDVADGATPIFVCATVGTTSSGAIDPLPEIAAVAQRAGLWLHVDAAMAGTAALCPELRHVHDGVEHADSYCFNPHKWMFTNFDCDCFWVADRAALIGALGNLPEYLRNEATEAGAVFDYRDWHVPLGRRFRALKLWFVIRHYGAQGLRHHVRRHVELARGFADRVRADERFVLVTEPPLNLVCLRHKGGDAATEAIMKEVNASGRAYLSHTRLGGHYVIRVSIGQTWTEERHVRRLWELLDACAG